MTATAEEYLKQRNTALREKLNKHLLRGMVTNAMESYHKESSKELVEALEQCIKALKVVNSFGATKPIIERAEKALENHLK